jgi:hypothetical protein
MRRFFALLWRGWKIFAHALGVVNTKILLTVSYFVIIAIAAVISRILGRDLLDKRWKAKPTYWTDRQPTGNSLESCKHQF